MITWGFVPAYSGIVTIGSPFELNNILYLGAYLAVGNGGNIVWLNQYGQAQYFPNALSGQVYLLGATQIVSSVVIGGNTYTTTASNMSWFAVNQLYESP